MVSQTKVIESETFLGDGMSITHRLVLRGNEVLDFVHQLGIVLDGQWTPIVRYDCAHGRPHVDILDRQGATVRWAWMRDGIDRKTASIEAENDLRDNADAYRAAFEGQHP